jgi:hypothetical protein
LIMRARFLLLALAATFATGVYAQQTIVVTSSGSAGGAGLYADGSAWPTTGGYTFDVGVFPVGFDPATRDRASLIAAWQSVRQTVPGAVTSWFRDGTATYFSITGSSALLRPTESPGSQYYVWGFNTRTTDGASEWILLTNPNWRVINSDTPRLPDQFDTKDTGTIAVIGQLSNGGTDLKAERPFSAALTISNQIVAFSVPAGQPATLSISARGTGLSYQWYSGAKGDTSAPIAGATRATYTVASLSATARFWVRVSNSTQSVDSETIAVTAAGDNAGISATHQVASLGYIAGQRLRIRQEVTYTGNLTKLDLAALLPAGWSYLSTDETSASTRPQAGTTDLLEWSWTTVPASPFSFSYVVAVPAGLTADQALTTLTVAVRDGVAHQSLAQPEPLALKAGPRFHTSDVNRNGRIDIDELLRVVSLYNTRNGTTRTGAYRVNATSEDGFDADATRTAAATLSVYHSADLNPRDGRLDLGELTRVIELYNARSGTTRTGAYFARGDTEDGFISGVAP